MKFNIILSPRVRVELRQVADWYFEMSRSQSLAEDWVDGFLSVISSLSVQPERCSLASETEHFPYDLREIRYGMGRRKTHRVLFRIVGDAVEIMAIRHYAQDKVTPDTL